MVQPADTFSREPASGAALRVILASIRLAKTQSEFVTSL